MLLATEQRDSSNMNFELADKLTELLEVKKLDEAIQKVFENVHENNLFDEPNIDQAYEVCELLIILRLQELFRETYNEEESGWSKIPMFVTAHEYEMIYKVN
jgi:hypothetical protein